MSRSVAVLLSALFLAGGPASAQSADQSVKLSAGVHLITAELADDDPMRTRGLMFRESLRPNHGMLFIFEGK